MHFITIKVNLKKHKQYQTNGYNAPDNKEIAIPKQQIESNAAARCTMGGR
jgi:hypothetical protein